MQHQSRDVQHDQKRDRGKSESVDNNASDRNIKRMVIVRGNLRPVMLTEAQVSTALKMIDDIPISRYQNR